MNEARPWFGTGTGTPSAGLVRLTERGGLSRCMRYDMQAVRRMISRQVLGRMNASSGAVSSTPPMVCKVRVRTEVKRKLKEMGGDAIQKESE